jgi:uncharacterized protein
MTPVRTSITIEVAPLPPELPGPVAIRLDVGATVADAMTALGLELPHSLQVGVWGRKASPTSRLEEGDRIEFYRPLAADPKSARRSRVRSAPR